MRYTIVRVGAVQPLGVDVGVERWEDRWRVGLTFHDTLAAAKAAYPHVQWIDHPNRPRVVAVGYMGGTDHYLVQRKCATCGGRVLVDRAAYPDETQCPVEVAYFRCERGHTRNDSKPGNPRA